MATWLSNHGLSATERQRTDGPGTAPPSAATSTGAVTLVTAEQDAVTATVSLGGRSVDVRVARKDFELETRELYPLADQGQPRRDAA